MRLIDTHSHFYGSEFSSDRLEVIRRAKQVGVEAVVLPNISCGTISELREMVDQHPAFCYPCMGLHPTSVKHDFEDQLQCVEKELGQNKYFGVGEIGIDLYWDKTFYPQQVEVFTHQLRLAKKYKLPVIIHSRNSMAEIFKVLDAEVDENLRGVFHSFSGSIVDYQHIMNYKTFYVGIGGVVTFKNSGLDKVVQNIKLDSLLVETDSPYLTPHPHRGKRNEPAYVELVAQKISEIHTIPVEEVGEVTTRNAKTLFGI